MTEAQNLQILNYLKTGKTITPLQALQMFGCFRLAARIYDLKNKGWPIHCERKVREDHLADYNKVVGHYSMTQDKLWWPEGQ
jgi:hypothetical protein